VVVPLPYVQHLSFNFDDFPHHEDEVLNIIPRRDSCFPRSCPHFHRGPRPKNTTLRSYVTNFATKVASREIP
jgi:hypothetical protein